MRRAVAVAVIASSVVLALPASSAPMDDQAPWLRVDDAELPPPGVCRLWYPDRPAAEQPAPLPCGLVDARELERAWLLADGRGWNLEYDWVDWDRRNPGTVSALVLEVATRARRDPASAGIATVIVAPSDDAPAPRRLTVSPAHHPGPGECRIWHAQRAIVAQPAPRPCAALRAPADRDDAWLLYEGEAWDLGYDWAALELRHPGTVPPAVIAVTTR